MTNPPPRRTVRKSHLDSILSKIGYEEVWSDHGARFSLIAYENNGMNDALPSPLTIAYPDVGVDGTLWYDLDYVFDLLDRLSGDVTDEILLTAFRNLDS